MTDENIREHLSEIEKHVRAARGEQIDRTPWDFKLPSGSDLKHLRKECNLSRKDVSNMADYSVTHLSAIETGGQAPGRECIRKLLLLYKREWPKDG